MESTTFSLSRTARSRYLLSGFFLLFGSIMGFTFTFNGAYSFVFTIFIFSFSLTGGFSSIFYFLSINRTYLKLSELSIEFIYPSGHKVVDWSNITRVDLNSAWFRLCYLEVPKSKSFDFISEFFYRKNEIPLHLFLNNWQNENCWNEEPILAYISKKLHWDEQK